MSYVDMAKQYSGWVRENLDDAFRGDDASHSESALGVLACRIVAAAALAGDVATTRRFARKMRIHAATVDAERRHRCTEDV